MSTRNRFTALVASAVAGSLILAGCGGGTGSASSDDDTVDVLVLTPMSGPLVTLGDTAIAGLTAAAKVINEEGGILGRDVKLTFEDNRFDPMTAQNILQEALTSDDRPDMVFSGVTSTETVAIMPLLTQYKVLSMGSAASPLATDPEKYPYGFSMFPRAVDYEGAMAKFLSEKGLTKVAAIISDSETGKAAQDALTSQGEEYGVEFEFEKLDAESVDATSELSRLMRNEPQALLLEGLTSGAPMTVVLDGKDKLGWDIPTFFGMTDAVSGIQNATEEQIRGTVLQGAAFGIKGSDRQQDDDFKIFQEAVDAELPTKDYQLSNHALSYSALMVLRAGAEKADSLEAPEVAEAIESLKTDEDIPGWFQTVNPGFADDQHQGTWAPEDFEFVELGFPGYDPTSGLYLPAEN
ncbi:ABC transporter substrate-binding protein [Nocardioides gansuensis]|nr:ABC transporter substrate-binding protein [Nocardioides gansuensis]